MSVNNARHNTKRLAAIGQHLTASIKGPHPGPTLIVGGGLHGNEPAGVLTAHRVLSELEGLRELLRGEVLALVGNTRARAPAPLTGL